MVDVKDMNSDLSESIQKQVDCPWRCKYSIQKRLVYPWRFCEHITGKATSTANRYGWARFQPNMPRQLQEAESFGTEDAGEVQGGPNTFPKVQQHEEAIHHETKRYWKLVGSRKVTRYTVEQRDEALKKINENRWGLREASRELQINHSTLQCWKRNATKPQITSNKPQSTGNKSRGRRAIMAPFTKIIEDHFKAMNPDEVSRERIDEFCRSRYRVFRAISAKSKNRFVRMVLNAVQHNEDVASASPLPTTDAPEVCERNDEMTENCAGNAPPDSGSNCTAFSEAIMTSEHRTSVDEKNGSDQSVGAHDDVGCESNGIESADDHHTSKEHDLEEEVEDKGSCGQSVNEADVALEDDEMPSDHEEQAQQSIGDPEHLDSHSSSDDDFEIRIDTSHLRMTSLGGSEMKVDLEDELSDSDNASQAHSVISVDDSSDSSSFDEAQLEIAPAGKKSSKRKKIPVRPTKKSAKPKRTSGPPIFTPMRDVSDGVNGLAASITVDSYQEEGGSITYNVLRQHLYLLDEGQFLNESILSYLIIAKTKPSCDILNMDCMFYATLIAYDQDKTKHLKSSESLHGLTKFLNWELYRVVQIPVNLNLHWSFLVVIDPLGREGKPHVYHVDSIPDYHFGAGISRKVMNYIAEDMKLHTSEETTRRASFTSIHVNPPQQNESDCGFYVFHYMKVICESIGAMSKEDIREKMQALCSGFTFEKCSHMRKDLKKELST